MKTHILFAGVSLVFLIGSLWVGWGALLGVSLLYLVAAVALRRTAARAKGGAA